MPNMPPKDTSILDWNRNTIKISGKSVTIFVSTNSKPDTYLGLKDKFNGLPYYLHDKNVYIYINANINEKLCFD